MALFIINILLSASIMEFACRSKQRTVQNFGIFLASILPVLLLAFRSSSVGTDTLGYMRTIINSAYGISLGGIEYLSNLFYRIGYALTGAPWGSFLLFAIVTVVPVLCTIRHYANTISPFVFTAFFLCFIYPYAFNLMRQTAAVAIIIYSYRFLTKKKTMQFFALIVVAMLFHTSAIAMVSLYVFQRAGCFQKKGKVVFAVALVIILFAIQPVLSFAQTLPIFSRYLSNYGRLESVNLLEMVRYFFNCIVRHLPIFVAVLAAFVICLSSEKKVDNMPGGLYTICCIVTCFLIAVTFDKYGTYLARIGIYYAFAIPFVLQAFASWTARFFRVGTKKLTASSFNGFICAYYIFYFWYINYYLGYQAIFPYEWIL